MMTGSPTSDQGRLEARRSLALEISQGRGASLNFPVRIRNLSARGVILTAGQVPGNLDLKDCLSRAAVIHLPTGEIREVRGNLIWARPRGEGSEIIFGLELSNSNLKVRRALEEQLLAYPQDLKNLWDHWDAVFDDYEGFGVNGQPASRKTEQTPRSEPSALLAAARAPQPESEPPSSDHAFYWVGFGGVLVGLLIYFMGPESYRLFGIILAVYGSLTVAGKSVWSLFQKRPRPQE